jgi:uncharacterized damage-inducible protein DinB
MERVKPRRNADERTSLLEMLNYQRATIVLKADRLDHAQLNQPLSTSTLTLAGLLKHLAAVEDSWISARFLGVPEPEPWLSAPYDEDDDWEFTSASADSPDYLRELYAAACARSDAVIDGADLDAVAPNPDHYGNPWTLRWVLLHLIEETARHAGHADLLREAIDGEVGE